MDSDPQASISLADETGGYEAMQDIEEKTSEKLREKRSSERMAVKSKVILQPGNSSEFLSYKVQGITGDISAGGCRAMFPVPIQVGDVYRLYFDKERLDIPLQFVRCLRCRMVGEDAFETGFSFFRPINLPSHLFGQK